MNSTALRERITKSLLNEIDEVQFPSVTMMDRAESALNRPSSASSWSGSRRTVTTRAEAPAPGVEALRPSCARRAG
jgi:hypothetical protein